MKIVFADHGKTSDRYCYWFNCGDSHHRVRQVAGAGVLRAVMKLRKCSCSDDSTTIVVVCGYAHDDDAAAAASCPTNAVAK